MSAPGLLDREHDRGEVLALVGVALVEHRGHRAFPARRSAPCRRRYQASVECSTAHFFLPSVLTPYSAMTRPE